MQLDARETTVRSPLGKAFWSPDGGEAPLLAWWLPLLRAGRQAMAEQMHWLIVLDEWQLLGRFLRKGRPDVWLYRHSLSSGELLVDHTGQCYRFIPNASGPSTGRFATIGIRAAVWRSGLPDVGPAVWWEQPPRHLDEDGAGWATPELPLTGSSRPALRVVR